ncbi:MAG: glycosyltransferase [Candidatus Krumholzibacteriia bacterium]
MRPRRFRVLHLVSELARGGTERLLFDLLSRLDPERYGITVGTTSGRDLPDVRREFEAAGLQTIQIPCALSRRRDGLAGKFGVLRSLTRALRRARPDAVHTHGPLNNTYGALAARLAGVPFVFLHDHNPVAAGLRSRLAVNLTSCMADAVFAASATVGARRRALLVRDAWRVVDLPNGVDLGAFRPPRPHERCEARRALGLPAEAYVCGAAGRLVDFKRLDLLVEAFPFVLRRLPGARLLLVGDGPERSRLLERARELGIDKHLLRLPWAPDVRTVYWALDVFVMPSDGREGFGLAAVEAMACGRPVVARRSPLFEEVLGEGGACLVEPRPRTIAAALLRLGRPGQQRARQMQLAREHAARNFDIERTALRLERVYASSFARKHPPAIQEGRPAQDEDHVHRSRSLA